MNRMEDMKTIKRRLSDVLPKKSVSSPVQAKEIKIEEPVIQKEETLIYTRTEREIPFRQSTVIRHEVFDYESKKQRSRSRFFIWLLAACSIAGLFMAVSFWLVRGTVYITPKSETAVVNTTLTAEKNAGEGTLGFEVMVLTEEGVVPTTNETVEATVQQKAVGTVIIYNAFGTSPIKLKEETRLMTPSGLIFKTDVGVTIPGMVGDKPGSIEVSVHADEFGEKYNVGLVDLSVVGFKGTTKETKVYARAKTQLQGGVGTGAPKQENIDAPIGASFEALKEKALAQIPEGYVAYPDAMFFDGGRTVLGDGTSTLTPQTLYVLLFKKEVLAQKIAESTLRGYDGGAVYIPELESLIVTLVNKETISPTEARSVSFTIEGQGKVIWSINEEEVKGKLVQTKKKDFQATMKQFTAVDTAELSLRPLWARTLPEKQKSITIKNSLK